MNFISIVLLSTGIYSKSPLKCLSRVMDYVVEVFRCSDLRLVMILTLLMIYVFAMFCTYIRKVFL